MPWRHPSFSGHGRQFYLIIWTFASSRDTGLYLRTIDDDAGVRGPQLTPVYTPLSINGLLHYPALAVRNAFDNI
jgi:hypothetical protein